MSFAQKDRLDRIQHIFLPTTEKKFHRKRMKNYEIRAFFEPQILTNPILTTQYYIEQPNTMFSEKGSDVIFLERFFLIMGRP